MSASETSSVSSTSTVCTREEDTQATETRPPVGCVEVRVPKDEQEGDQQEEEGDEFVLAVVADRALQARQELSSNYLENVAIGKEATCRETGDICEAKDDHMGTNVAKTDSGDLRKEACKSGKHRAMEEVNIGATSRSSKKDSSSQVLEDFLVLEEQVLTELSVSRPGAVHVSNPLAQVTIPILLERDVESSSSSSACDGEVSLGGISAQLVQDDCSGEAPTVELTCSDRFEDAAPVLEGDNVVAVCKEDVPGHRWFLYRSLSGIALLILVILLLVLGLAGVFEQPPEEEDVDPHIPPPLSKLEQIREAGVLKCGYNAFAPSEFEETLCRVLAAAIMGEAAEIELVSLPLMDQRFAGLANGEVDLLNKKITHTMERDVYQESTGSSFAFSTPYLYDGLKMAGNPFFVQCAEDNLNHLGECSDLKVCVMKDTTHYPALAELLPERNIVPLEFLYTSRTFVSDQLSKGICNLVAADRIVLAPDMILETGYEGDYAVTERHFAHDPLATVTSSKDPQFSDFVNTVLEALLVAEERNITQVMAHTFPQTTLFGDVYQDMFRNALAVAGHFGEIYARYMAPDLPRDSLNQINDGTTGLIFSHPFGAIDHGRKDKPLGPHMQHVLDRGVLRCGIRTGRVGFARESVNGVAGIDADYCRAVAAALFEGDKTKVEYVQVEDEGDGFALLADGSVDVVAGATKTLENNVREPTTGLGLAFSQPYFYSPYEDNLSLATRQECKDWSSFVYWIVSSTFYAEEHNITSANSFPMPEVHVYGPTFHRMFRDAILAVGSYAEIYDRNLEQFVPRAGRNQLNHPSLGPQHYPLPGFFPDSR